MIVMIFVSASMHAWNWEGAAANYAAQQQALGFPNIGAVGQGVNPAAMANYGNQQQPMNPMQNQASLVKKELRIITPVTPLQKIGKAQTRQHFLKVFCLFFDHINIFHIKFLVCNIHYTYMYAKEYNYMLYDSCMNT
jgi:hypothetical protein